MCGSLPRDCPRKVAAHSGLLYILFLSIQYLLTKKKKKKKKKFIFILKKKLPFP